MEFVHIFYSKIIQNYFAKKYSTRLLEAKQDQQREFQELTDSCSFYKISSFNIHKTFFKAESLESFLIVDTRHQKNNKM